MSLLTNKGNFYCLSIQMDRRLDRICKRLWSNKESGTPLENTGISETDTKRKKPNFSIEYLLSENANQAEDVTNSNQNEAFNDL